eukprot:3934946-Rhodomonas_salina.1
MSGTDHYAVVLRKRMSIAVLAPARGCAMCSPAIAKASGVFNLHACSGAMSRTETAHPTKTISLRGRYAMPGTQVAYGATRLQGGWYCRAGGPTLYQISRYQPPHIDLRELYVMVPAHGLYVPLNAVI